MYSDRNLDDLIIEEPESEGSKLKNLLTLLALLAIIIILGTILYRLVTGGSDIEPKKEPSSEKKEITQKSESSEESKIKEAKSNSQEVLPAELHPIIKDKYSEPQNRGYYSQGAQAYMQDDTQDSSQADSSVSERERETKARSEASKPKEEAKPKKVRKQSPAKLFKKVEHTNSSATKKRGYYVQVGSFKRQPAESFLNKLRDSGFHPVLVKSGSMIKVRVGPYPTRAKANEALKRVKTKLGIDGFVLRKK